jgi:integral membrane protein
MTLIFRITAFLEGISYLLLLGIGVPLKYLFDNDTWVKALGMPHGLLFVGYLIIAFLIKDDQKWSNKTFALVGIASVIPFGTFWVEKKYIKPN